MRRVAHDGFFEVPKIIEVQRVSHHRRQPRTRSRAPSASAGSAPSRSPRPIWRASPPSIGTLGCYYRARPDGARAGPRRRREDRARRGSRPARRRAGRRSRICSSPRASRPPPARKILEGWVPPYDGTAVAQAQAGGRGAARQAVDGRVRHGLVERELRLRPGAQSVGSASACPAARRAARPPPSRPACAPARSAPTPAARSASRRRSPASSASSPPTAASRATAWSRSPRRSIRSARSAARRSTARYLLEAIAGHDPHDATSLERPVPRLSRRLRAHRSARCASASRASISRTRRRR